MNKEVNLTKRVETPDGLRFCPVVESNRPGFFKANLVIVNGKEERHPEGTYYIDWREGSKRIRKAVGKDIDVATAERNRRSTAIAHKNSGGQVVEPNGQKDSRRIIGNKDTGAIADYLQDLKDIGRKKKTLAAYTTALSYFTESCKKTFIEEIDRKDLTKFVSFLTNEKEQSARSVYNKFENAMSFLKSQGLRGLVEKKDWPRFVQEEPEIYEQEDFDALFKVCDEHERMWYEFFLMTGMREQEVMYTYWTDINLAAGTVSVTHKPDRSWTPKAYKERTIPISDKLVKSLRAWKAMADKKCSLLFPTAGCKPKFDFLDCLKAVAKRAELNPDNFWLHKFRATFATRCLWAGADLRTVQQWLGHTDIESTMRYLKPQRGQAARQKMNEVFA